MLLSWPIGLLALWWLFVNGTNILRWYRAGYVECTPRLLTLTNGCDQSTYNITFAWAQLIIVLGVLVGSGSCWAAGWCARSRMMADTVARLGPTSLGMRLDASGPRDETRHLAEAINAMLDRVAEGYEAQQRFAANASHELRTPLATQRALIEVSLGERSPRTSSQLLSRQLLATNARNEALIEGLLVLAETERGLVVAAPATGSHHCGRRRDAAALGEAGGVAARRRPRSRRGRGRGSAARAAGHQPRPERHQVQRAPWLGAGRVSPRRPAHGRQQRPPGRARQASPDCSNPSAAARRPARSWRRCRARPHHRPLGRGRTRTAASTRMPIPTAASPSSVALPPATARPCATVRR